MQTTTTKKFPPRDECGGLRLAVQARSSQRSFTAWLGRRASELSAHAVEEVKSYYMLWLPGMNQSLQRENVHGLLDWKRLKKQPWSFPAVICHVRPVKWQPALWLIPTFSQRLRLSSAFESRSTSALSDKQVIMVSFQCAYLKVNLTRRMECFPNSLDLFHMSFWKWVH